MATLREVQKALKTAHNRLQSWRAVARLPEYLGLSHATLSAIARGRDPADPRIRERLGLPPVATVIPIDGTVAPGAQTIGSLNCICCGRPFIPNHWARRRCFICRPIRKKRV